MQRGSPCRSRWFPGSGSVIQTSRNFGQRRKKTSAWTILFSRSGRFLVTGPCKPAYWAPRIVLRAGDIHPNPRPPKPKWPCGLNTCGKPVGRPATQCSACLDWFHYQCTCLSYHENRKRPSRHYWKCAGCTTRAPPTSTSISPVVG